MNRHQDKLCLYSVNPRSTVAKLLIEESVPKYVKEEVLDGIQIMAGRILLPSDRSGSMQLYMYSMTGQLQGQLTKGAGEVTTVYGYDERTGNVYYQAAGKDPMNREVYVTMKTARPNA